MSVVSNRGERKAPGLVGNHPPDWRTKLTAIIIVGGARWRVTRHLLRGEE